MAGNTLYSPERLSDLRAFAEEVQQLGASIAARVASADLPDDRVLVVGAWRLRGDILDFLRGVDTALRDAVDEAQPGRKVRTPTKESRHSPNVDVGGGAKAKPPKPNKKGGKR
jgi:hypothetical protein